MARIEIETFRKTSLENKTSLIKKADRLESKNNFFNSKLLNLLLSIFSECNVFWSVITFLHDSTVKTERHLIRIKVSKNIFKQSF